MAGFTFAPAPAAGASFSFGAPASSNTASAPSTGFSFGSTAPAANISTNPAPNKVTPSSSFSFGGASGASAGFATNPSSSGTIASSTNVTAPITNVSSNFMKVPQFQMAFPNLAYHAKLEALLEVIQDPGTPDTALTYLGEELNHLLSSENPIGKALSNPISLGDDVNANTTLRSNLATVMKVQLPSKVVPTPLTKSMLDNIFEISDALHIKEDDAAILYNAVILDSLDEETLGVETVEWFQKRHKRPSSLDDIVHISVAKAQDNGTYISRIGKSADITMEDHGEGNESVLSAVNLYLNERGQILKTLLMLIQLRVSISTSFYVSQELSIIDSIILKSTDNLLNQKVIESLIQVAKKLTLKNDQVAEKIYTALDKVELLSSTNFSSLSGNHTYSSASNKTSGGSVRLFDMSQPKVSSFSGSVAAGAAFLDVHDADYCLYDFTFDQRHLVCQCLFYVAYHTQLEIQEVTDIIDLLRDLTNGQSMGGIGGGLPILDPIRDVPDPYIISWNDVSIDQKQGPQFSIPMTPHQSKIEKVEDEWRQELVDSLWSIRGLTKATFCTSTDYQGHEIFHKSTIKEHGSNAEAIGHGKPQLMQCSSLLLMAIMCALDANNILLNRVLHSPNPSVGNMFVSPESTPSVLQALLPIRKRIDPDINGSSKWRRQDIEGLVSAAFGLLLRPVTEQLISPRSGDSGTCQIKSTFKACIERPSICKSFTFARVSLIPCLGFASRVPSSLNQENDFSFLISVLSEFTSSYVDTICSFSQLPDSRAKWMNVETQELELSYVRENQRKQMNTWSGQEHKEEVLPTEVDESRRPDCLDDIIALIVNLCVSNSDCPNSFWFYSDSKTLEPSRIMKKLETAILNDDSLVPSYIFLLSAISLADVSCPNSTNLSGAQSVYDWLCENSRLLSSIAYDSSKQLQWEYIVISLRYYAKHISPTDDNLDIGAKSGEKYDADTYEDSTSYYYGADENAVLNTVTTSTDSHIAQSSSRSSRKDLSDIDLRTLESMICLISNISAKSPSCRRCLLSIRILDNESKKFSTVDDDILSILFSLLVASLSSELKGLVLTAISHLVRRHDLSDLSTQENDQADDAILRCWELLEACQIVPVVKFSQYNALLPSFSSNIDSPDKMKWLPKEDQNGILYEMEYVESIKGNYPATEGILKLLSTLFLSQIQPTNLGHQCRQQTGCTPYVEYVIDFVLPRVIGMESNSRALYFSSTANKFRLLARALEVIDAVLSSYVPLSSESSNRHDPKLNVGVGATENKSLNGTSSSQILLDSLDHGPLHDIKDRIISRLISRDIELEIVRDFGDDALFGSMRSFTDIENKDYIAQNSLPHRKSAGFSVLADILSSNGSLVKILLKILSESQHRSQDEHLNAFFCAMSLYGEAYPSFDNARDGRNYLLLSQKVPVHDIGITLLSSKYLKSFLRPLYPEITEFSSQVPLSNTSVTTANPNDVVLWKDTCILHSIRLLCGAAARYQSFCSSLTYYETCTRYIPVLSFHRKRVTAGAPLSVKTLQIINLPKLLSESFVMTSHGSRQSLLSLLSAVVAYQSYGLSRSNNLSTYAIALTQYILTNASPGTTAYHDGTHGFCSRLALIKNLYKDEGEYQISQSILNIICESLMSQKYNERIGYDILGLSKPDNEFRDYLRKCAEGFPCELCDHQNGLDIIIHLVSDTGFVLNRVTAPLASKCFEILYRICSFDTDETESDHFFMRLSVMEKLRESDFWCKQLYQYLRTSSDSHSILSRILCQVKNRYPELNDVEEIGNLDSNILHCISWLFKGISLELHALMGSPSLDFGFSFFYEKNSSASPKRLKCNEFLNFLLGENRILLKSFRLISAHTPTTPHDLMASLPSRDILRLSSGSMFDLSYVERYMSEPSLEINAEDKKARVDTVTSWCKLWNIHVSFLSAVTDLTKSWTGLTSTIFSSCTDILFSPLLCEENLAANVISSMDIISSLLTCIDFRRLTTIQDLDALALLAQSTLPVIDSIFRSDSIDRFINHEQLAKIIFLCVEAIASCGANHTGIDSNKNEIAVIVGGGLSVILNSDIVCRAASSIIFMDDKCRSSCLFAGDVLAHVCLPRLKRADSDTNVDSFESIARSALISILHFVESQDSLGDRLSNFVSDLFTSSLTKDVLQKLIRLFGTGDGDTPHLLQAISCSTGGGILLVENGVVESMLSASTSFLEHMDSTLNPVSMRFQYPSFLYAHVALLTALIHSNIPQYSLYQLLREASKFVEIHVSTISNLLSSYPTNHDLTHLYLQLLASLCSRVSDSANMSIAVEITVMSKLDNRIAMLTNQLSQFPYPPEYLSLLPHRLREAHARRLRHNRFQNGHNQSDQCWWDAVSDLNDLNPVPLRNPPTGSINMSSSQASSISKTSRWTMGKYYTSYSAMKCAQIGYMYLLQRAKDTDDSTSVDILNLCLSLSRMCDIARAIEDRITYFYEMENKKVNQIIYPLGGLQGNNSESPIAFQNEEQDILLRSGVLVASSIAIALEILKINLEISRRHIAIVGMGDVKEDSKNILCALESCRIETAGVGCTKFLTDSSKIDAESRFLARTLLISAKQLLEI